MELQIERSERLMAPLPFVWDEMNSLDELLNKTAHLANYEVLLSGDRAHASTILAWGPIKKRLRLDVKLLGIVAERQVRYAIEAATLGSRLEASIDLIPFGPNETKLNYRAGVEVRSRHGRHRRHLLDEIAEDHVDTLIGHVKAKSEKIGRASCRERV